VEFVRVSKPGPDDENGRAVSDPSKLARLAGMGDTAATARLLRLLAPEVLRVVRGVMGPYAAEVDDAVQQALIALVHALPAFRGECAPAGYACRIALRTALAVRKRVQRSRLRVDLSADADALPGRSCSSERSEAGRRTDLLRGLLDELPSEQAEALAMRTMLGWSLDEIAHSSGAPVNTVRSRLRLAKEAMRAKIEANPSLAEELGLES
jgi:RNA polymerase sigma-70 factor (ECF subfamily)